MREREEAKLERIHEVRGGVLLKPKKSGEREPARPHDVLQLDPSGHEPHSTVRARTSEAHFRREARVKCEGDLQAQRASRHERDHTAGRRKGGLLVFSQHGDEVHVGHEPRARRAALQGHPAHHGHRGRTVLREPKHDPEVNNFELHRRHRTIAERNGRVPNFLGDAPRREPRNPRERGDLHIVPEPPPEGLFEGINEP